MPNQKDQDKKHPQQGQQSREDKSRQGGMGSQQGGQGGQQSGQQRQGSQQGGQGGQQSGKSSQGMQQGRSGQHSQTDDNQDDMGRDINNPGRSSTNNRK